MNVVIDLAKARAYRGLGVVVIFLSGSELYYVSMLLSSASWSRYIIDMPVVTQLIPCTMFSGMPPFSFNFSCSSYLNGHDPLY